MNLEQEIQIIKVRNQRVEADKAWEISWTRRLVLAVLTYSVIVVLFMVIELPQPFISALVPTIGFIVSTLSLSVVKKIWLKNQSKK